MPFPFFFSGLVAMSLHFGGFNELLPMSIDEQMAKADAIIIGTGNPSTLCTTGTEQIPCSVLTEVTFLKGESEITERNVTVMLFNGIAEARVHCCTSNKRYLMFLYKYRDRYYFVNGRFSAIQLLEVR